LDVIVDDRGTSRQSSNAADPPRAFRHGRAPGWQAGLFLAQRQAAAATINAMSHGTG
jgi:hypothetical protein